MKAILLFCLSIGIVCHAFGQHVGPPNNVGREYGNPKMPLVVSHLAGANKKMLERVNRNSRHSIFAKILCFRKLCRIQSGHTASLNAISFKRFRKKIARNARKGLYKRPMADSLARPNRIPIRETPVVADTISVIASAPVKADTLIILGAEILFEINKSTLRSEHFGALNPIVEYLVTHPDRFVKVSGHTDNSGSESHNLSLSKKRADVVAEYLVNNGVDIGRVNTFGFGSSKPIGTNASEQGRKKNRRVELLISDQK